MTQESPKGAQKPLAASAVPLPPPVSGMPALDYGTPEGFHPAIKSPIEPITATEELRAMALTLAVEYAKHWNKPSMGDVFSVSDEMLAYIQTGEYTEKRD